MSDAQGAEPMIYVMPERFYVAPGKGLSPKTIFIIAVSVLFVLVVGGATWYFTRDLRQVAAPSAPLAIEPPAAPVKEETPPISPEAPISAAPVVVPPVEEAKPAPEMPPVLTRGQDTDSDGLTDAEEEIFGTNATLPDTDGDGYLDGHEVFYLYNPAGTAPQKLEETNLVARYKNPSFSYSILYPSKWTTAGQGADNKEVDFTSATGEYISVAVKDNKENLSLEDWLKNQTGEKSLADLEPVATRLGLAGLIAKDKTAAYFLGNGTVFVINYNLAGKSVLEYTRIFEMMVSSLVLK